MRNKANNLLVIRYLVVLTVIISIICFGKFAYTQSGDATQKPEINSVELEKASVVGGTTLTVTVKATSNSPITWLNRSFDGPAGNIYSGGSGVVFTEVDGEWVYTWTDFVSEHAPSGTYSYTNISVRNESMKTSDVWPETVSVVVENESNPEKPAITDVDLSKNNVAGGTELILTITATSNSPVKWLNRSFDGPAGNIYSGGSGVDFTEDNGEWVYTWTDFVSEHAPSGTYSYTNISVRNEGMKTSDVWSQSVSTIIENASSPEKPVINSITLSSSKSEEGTTLTGTINVTSSSPVTWLNKAFFGPAGNIYGGGGTTTFTPKGNNTWQYIWTDFVSKHAPSGRYYYTDISVRNEGMETSAVWAGEPGETINNELNPSPQVKDVEPVDGKAVVVFPDSNITIEIYTSESGTISVTKYTEHDGDSPEGTMPAGIYLDINPSLNLQGKTATIIVGYSLPLPAGLDEQSLKLYRWGGSSWNPLPNQVLDTSAKTITATVNGFSTFGVFGTSSVIDDIPDPLDVSFEEVIERFLKVLNYEGDVEHEHEFKFWGGGSSFYGRGLGGLYGTQVALTRESPVRRSYSSSSNYTATTEETALREQSMGMVSGFGVGRSYSATTGVRPNAGEEASIKEDVDLSRDKDGEYYKSGITVNNTDGTTRINSNIAGASTTAEVEGTVLYHKKVVVESGGASTGWWDLP